MDEITKRLEEIAAESRVISSDENLSHAEKIEKRTKLLEEARELKQKVADAEADATLEKELAEATTAKEETPAEETAPETTADGGGEGDGDGGEGDGGEGAGEGDGDAGDPEGADATAEEKVAIAAAVNAATPESDAKVVSEASPAAEGLTIVASADSGTVRRGNRLTVNDFESIHNHSRSLGANQVHKFGEMNLLSGDGPVLSDLNTPLQNAAIMQSAGRGAELQAITAAACYCGPFETEKMVPALGEQDRPVQGIFDTRAFTGPFNYTPELALSDVAAGVNKWECADQDLVDDTNQATWKDCVELQCASTAQVDPYAIVACGIHDVFQSLSHPELVDSFIRQLGTQYARTAEQLLIDELRATTTVLTYAATNLDLFWELNVLLGHLAGHSGYTQRIDWSNYVAVLPPGFLPAMQAGENIRGFSRGSSTADLIGRLRELGLGGVVEAREASTANEGVYTAAAAKYNAPPGPVVFDPNDSVGVWEILLIPVAAYSVGSRTIVEAGMTRDSRLIRQNKVQYFLEGGEYVEKMLDIPAYTLQITGYGNGGRSALATPDLTEL